MQSRDKLENSLQYVLDQTHAVIYTKNLEGVYLFVNQQYCKIFDIPQERILGKTDYDFFPKEVADGFRKNDLEVRNTNKHVESEEVAIHADGQTHNYLSLKFPLRDSTGRVYGTGGVSTDITQYRKLEEELSRAKRMEALGLLAGGIAHDFNNILGTILLVADTLLVSEKRKNSEWREGVGSIRKAAQSAALMARRLLAFGNRQTRRPENIDLAVVVKGTKKIIEHALGEDVRMKLKIAPPLPAVCIDPSQIEQLMANLCFNAREAMPTGGTLSVTLASAKGGVNLTVEDTGTGISPDALERVFEPFFTTKPDGHTGLGLATVHAIVKAASGKIEVESQPGVGTKFRVFLPAGDEVSPRRTRGKSKRGAKGRGATILLVEDHRGLRRATASILREHGYLVIESAGAKAALKEWKKAGRAIDLVISDIVMPGTSGLEMVQKMKKASGPVRAVFVSAYSQKKLSDYNLTAKSFSFLEKPYTAEALLGRVNEALKKRLHS